MDNACWNVLSAPALMTHTPLSFKQSTTFWAFSILLWPQRTTSKGAGSPGVPLADDLVITLGPNTGFALSVVGASTAGTAEAVASDTATFRGGAVVAAAAGAEGALLAGAVVVGVTAVVAGACGGTTAEVVVLSAAEAEPPVEALQPLLPVPVVAASRRGAGFGGARVAGP